MTTTTPRAITLRSLLPRNGNDHAGTLALLAAHGMTTVADVEDAAVKWRVSLRMALLAAGLPWSRAEELAGKIEETKREEVR
jgi:hypothetical protein